jgi:hypothetical protein
MTTGTVSRGQRIVVALMVTLLAALAWSLCKGILELGVGLLAVAVLGGWSIGAVVRPIRRAPLIAIAFSVLAWLGGLVGTWLIAMALLQASSRTFIERLGATPFVDWLSPQFGLLEIISLLLFMGSAAYGARPGR